MASFIKKGKDNWAARLRKRGHEEVYQSGFRTKAEAMDWARRVEPTAFPSTHMKGAGPHHTTLAAALNDFVKVVTRKQAGCKQALCKINKYLEGGALPRLKAIQIKGGRIFHEDADGNLNAAQQEVQKAEFELVEEDGRSFHLGAQQAAFARRGKEVRAKGANAQALRARLAKMKVAEVQSFHFEELVLLMEQAGYKANTIRQELAILSGFFSHAIRSWKWRLPENPLLTFAWPTGESRDRVLSDDEISRVSDALGKCRNKKFQYFVVFALETAMRKGEAISTVCWCDLDWGRKTLNLPHAKAGRREVPLSEAALDILRGLEQGAPTDKIFGLSEAQVQSSWSRVCRVAKVVDVHIHDLRHTAATYYAKALNGNKYLLKLITGISSDAILARYVNMSADDAVQALASISRTSPGQRMLMPSGLASKQEENSGISCSEGRASSNVVSLATRRSQLALTSSGGLVSQGAREASGSRE